MDGWMDGWMKIDETDQMNDVVKCSDCSVV